MHLNCKKYWTIFYKCLILTTHNTIKAQQLITKYIWCPIKGHDKNILDSHQVPGLHFTIWGSIQVSPVGPTQTVILITSTTSGQNTISPVTILNGASPQNLVPRSLKKLEYSCPAPASDSVTGYYFNYLKRQDNFNEHTFLICLKLLPIQSDQVVEIQRLFLKLFFMSREAMNV